MYRMKIEDAVDYVTWYLKGKDLFESDVKVSSLLYYIYGYYYLMTGKELFKAHFYTSNTLGPMIKDFPSIERRSNFVIKDSKIVDIMDTILRNLGHYNENDLIIDLINGESAWSKLADFQQIHPKMIKKEFKLKSKRTSKYILEVQCNKKFKFSIYEEYSKDLRELLELDMKVTLRKVRNLIKDNFKSVKKNPKGVLTFYSDRYRFFDGEKSTIKGKVDLHYTSTVIKGTRLIDITDITYNILEVGLDERLINRLVKKSK